MRDPQAYGRRPAAAAVARRIDRRATPPAELVKALDAYVGHRFAAPSKPEEVQKRPQDEFLAKAQAQRDVAARLIWDRLYHLDQTERSEAKLRGLAELLDKVQPPPSEEGLLVKRLAEWKPSAINWPGAAAAEDAAGVVVAGRVPWCCATELDEADKAKRAGEDELFRAGSSVAARPRPTASPRPSAASRGAAERP